MQGYINISKYAGMREDLVQAGGGNSSYKITADRMVIKASGYQLADITEKEGFAVINPKIIRDAFLNNKNLDSMTDDESKKILQEAFIEGSRPSIETFLHAVSGTYTLHTHPIVVNALACRKNGMSVLSELIPDALIVPYATPGVELAKSYFSAYRQALNGAKKKFDTVFLQNHGLVVSADSASEVIEKTEEITGIIESYLKCDLSSYHRLTELWQYFPDKIVWKVTDQNIDFAYGKLGKMWNHAFCPDCIVFLGKKLLDIHNEISKESILEFCSKFGSPIMIRYKNQMYLIADSVKKALETQSVLSFSAQVMLLNENEECCFLNGNEQNFLLNWDAEKYRKNMK